MCADRFAVCTTAYPGVERFLGHWYQSVEAQRDRAFDLWVALDGLTPADVVRAVGRTPDAEFVTMRPGMTPAQIRSETFSELARRYPAVIPVDSDDVLHPTRVGAARDALRHADLAACALDLMDDCGADLGAVFSVPVEADAAEMLPRYNVFGLSNTAYRSETLRGCLPVPDECVLIDWLLATRAWAGGARLSFDRTPRMRYRQHAANTAPMLPPFDPGQVLTATRRVLGHYAAVLDGGWPLPASVRARVEAERRRVRAFDAAVRENPAALARYVDELNALPPMRVWWWQVAHPSLESTWSN